MKPDWHTVPVPAAVPLVVVGLEEEEGVFLLLVAVEPAVHMVFPPVVQVVAGVWGAV